MKNPNRKVYYVGAATLLIFLFFASPVFASDLLDQTTTLYQTAAANFQSKMVTFGIRLLFVLLSIQIGIDGMKILIEGAELNDLFKKLLMTVIVATTYAALIKMCSSLLPAILNLFTSAGQAGSGLPALTPSGLISQGIDVIDVLSTTYDGNSGYLDKLNPVASLELVLVELAIFAGFVALALQMVMTTISGFFWTAVTPLMLGFGGLSYTRDMATTTMKGGIAVGMKILVAYLLAAVGGQLAPLLGLAVAQASPLHPQPMFMAAAASVIFVGLAWKLPALAADLTNGSASLTAGDAIKGAAMMAAGVAGAGMAGASLAAAGAKAAGGAAANATGVAKALSAGMDSAADHGKTGLGAAAHAMGEVGQHGLGMAKGAIGDKVAGGKASFASAVDNSTGGKIASSIQSERGGSMAGVPVPSSADSGSSASGAASSNSEGSGSSSASSSGSPGESADVTGGSGGTSAVSASSGNAASSNSSAPAAPTSGGSGAIPVPPSAVSGAGPGNDSAIPAPVAESGGNASNASITGGGGDTTPPPKTSALKATQDRMKSLAGYVPDDSHTVTVAANISHKHE